MYVESNSDSNNNLPPYTIMMFHAKSNFSHQQNFSCNNNDSQLGKCQVERPLIMTRGCHLHLESFEQIHNKQEKGATKDVEAVRNKVILTLESLLRRRCTNLDSMDVVQKTAKSLEKLLFNSAPTIETYCDLSTLEDRMRLVLTVQIQRRLSRSSKRSRADILRKTMGKIKYQKAKELVREIKLQKNKKVATMKCSGGVCSRPFSKDFPQVIRSLFFETALLDAFERSPLDKVHSVNWDGLISNAQGNLQAYNKWTNQV